MVVEEVLEEMNLTENEMRIGLLGEFMKKLYSRLPEDIDRRKLIHEVRDKLIAEYHVLLARV